MTAPAVPEAAQEKPTESGAATQPTESNFAPAPAVPGSVPEIGGRRDGTDPTRFGDWEKQGRCVDF